MHCEPAYALGSPNGYVVTGDKGKVTTFVSVGDGISIEESVYPLCGMAVETTVTPPDELRPAVKVHPDTYQRRMFDRPVGDHD